jgi:hypothetical protein
VRIWLSITISSHGQNSNADQRVRLYNECDNHTEGKLAKLK